MPRFSIIIPTYRRVSMLKEAINSVQNQSYEDFECIVVNSFPNDNKTINSYISGINDSRIKCISSDISLNGNQARNIGIKESSAEYIAFLDDDDIWFPEKLKKHLIFHEKNKAIGLIFSNSIKKWGNNAFYDVIVPEFVPNLNNITDNLLAGKFCPPTTSAVSVKKECFKSVGCFDENLISFQDWDMWLRISRKYTFGHLNECLNVFYQHLGDRTSQSTEKRLKGLADIVKKHQLEKTGLSKTFLMNTYRDTAFNLIISKKKTQSIKWIFKLLKTPIRSAQFQAIKLLILLIFGLRVYVFTKNLLKS